MGPASGNVLLCLRTSPLFLGEHSLQKNPRTSTNGSQQFESINQLLRAGDIQVLASCPNLTKVDMECTKVEGTNERLNVLCVCGPVHFFWKNFLFCESYANSLEWLAGLGEISGKLPRSIRNLSLPFSHTHIPVITTS